MISTLTKPAIQKIPAYIPGDSIESVKEKYHVTEILKLASNENQLGTSPLAMKAMTEALSQVNLYPDAFCMELRTKIGKTFGLTPHNVVISVGASGAISLIGEVFLCPGDEVIYCNPTFGAYRGATARNSAVPIALPLLEQGAYDLEGIRKAITPKTKLIFVCNPNNPTGYAYSHEQLKAFIDSIPKHVITVMDEAYIEFSGDPNIRSTVDLISEERNLIVLRTFSKLYGLAGVRIGYTLTNTDIHGNLQKATSVFTGNRVGLAGCLAALDDTEFVERSVANVVEGRKYLTTQLEAMNWEVFPSYANFIYANSKVDTAALAEKCKSRGLIIRGNFDYSRITVGTPAQNRRVIEILQEVLAQGV